MRLPVHCGEAEIGAPAVNFHVSLPVFPSMAYRLPSFEPKKTRPSGVTTGEESMRAFVVKGPDFLARLGVEGVHDLVAPAGIHQAVRYRCRRVEGELPLRVLVAPRMRRRVRLAAMT
jgi:hypothetical protein